ncbi:MAG: anti-sigma factor family protein [Bacteroidota bacterium]
MMTHKRIQKQLYDYLLTDLTDEMKREVEQHLSGCTLCNTELQSLRSTLSLVNPFSSSPADSRGPEFWDEFATSITERIADQAPARNRWWTSIRESMQSIVVPQRRLLISVGGVIAIVGIIMFGWNTWQHRSPEESFSSIQRSEQIAFVEDPLGQYFRRSKVLLVGLSNMKTADGIPVDLTAERSISRELIREARAFGDEPLDPRSTLLLRDLQKILVELANMEQTTDIPNVEIIRSGIRQENLLFKIRMAEATRDSVRTMQAKYSYYEDNL